MSACHGRSAPRSANVRGVPIGPLARRQGRHSTRYQQRAILLAWPPGHERNWCAGSKVHPANSVGGVAQLEERMTVDQKVAGSSPASAPTFANVVGPYPRREAQVGASGGTSLAQGVPPAGVGCGATTVTSEGRPVAREQRAEGEQRQALARGPVGGEADLSAASIGEHDAPQRSPSSLLLLRGGGNGYPARLITERLPVRIRPALPTIRKSRTVAQRGRNGFDGDVRSIDAGRAWSLLVNPDQHHNSQRQRSVRAAGRGLAASPFAVASDPAMDGRSLRVGGGGSPATAGAPVERDITSKLPAARLADKPVVPIVPRSSDARSTRAVSTNGSVAQGTLVWPVDRGWACVEDPQAEQRTKSGDGGSIPPASIIVVGPYPMTKERTARSLPAGEVVEGWRVANDAKGQRGRRARTGAAPCSGRGMRSEDDLGRQWLTIKKHVRNSVTSSKWRRDWQRH